MLFCALSMIFSCSKENDNPNSLKSFYKIDRRILLQENFVDNKNSWILVSEKEFPDCDLPEFCVSKILNGLFLENQDEICQCTSNASWTIPAQSLKYLAVEVEFTDFAIDIGWGFQGSDRAKNTFRFSLNGKGLVIGRNVEGFDALNINLGGHKVHFLLDVINDRVCAISDQTISFNGKDTTDISDLAELIESSSDQIMFTCDPGFGDVEGSIPGNISIKSITLYEPLF